MSTGFRVQRPEEWTARVDEYRRNPWLWSLVGGAIFGFAVGASTSWLRGLIAGGVLFLVVRFALGPYLLRQSRS